MALTCSKISKIYFVIEIQIVTGFDHICCIRNPEKYKYYEFTKYIGNINSHRVVLQTVLSAKASSARLDVLKRGVNLL